LGKKKMHEGCEIIQKKKDEKEKEKEAFACGQIGTRILFFFFVYITILDCVA
jgi:hypothetical protein